VKTKYITTKLVVVSAISIALVLVLLKAGRGGLEQPSAFELTTNNLAENYNLAALAVTPAPQPTAFDCFLKIDGVAGESTDDKHKDWIDVISYFHGITNAAAGVGGAAAARPALEDFSITKRLDKSSPKLALYCCKGQGQRIKEVTLELYKDYPNAGSNRFMKYVLSDVIVTSFRPGGDTTNGQTLPLEEVSFNCGKIEWTYTERDAAGNAKGDIKTSWDIAANKAN